MGVEKIDFYGGLEEDLFTGIYYKNASGSHAVFTMELRTTRKIKDKNSYCFLLPYPFGRFIIIPSRDLYYVHFYTGNVRNKDIL